MRKQHDEIDLAAAAERLDRGAAGVARGRHHDGAALAVRGQHSVHQPRQQLHRQILERQSGAMEQFERECIDAELRDRCHGRMAERAVSFAHHAGEVGLGDGVADKKPDDFDRDLGIGPAGESSDRFRFEPRPGLRNVKAAVAGQTREHDFRKAERRGLAPGRDVLH